MRWPVTCQFFSREIRVYIVKLKTLILKSPMERVMVDLADFGAYSSDGKPRYLISVIDHFSSLVRVYPLLTKTKDEVWYEFRLYM